MRWTATLAALAAGLWLSGRAAADIALPVVKKTATVTIEVDEKAKGTKVLVPSSAITERRRPGPPGRGALDGLTLPTAVAGCCLALSLGAGGVWLARRGSTGRGTVAVVLVGSLVLGSGAFLWANVPPFPKPAPATTTTLYEGEAAVEAFTNDAAIRVVLSPDALKALVEKAGKKGE
jgi:hypothetical protein